MAKFNTYTIYSRFFPCILSALPLFVLWFFLCENIKFKELWDYLLSLKFYGGATLSIVFIYFYAQVLRITSKFIEENLFHKKDGFPTTYFMTYSDNNFSKKIKDKFRELVKKEFDYDLLNETEEAKDIIEARKRLNEAIQFIRIKIGKGYLVFSQNIWYGFVRNLIGGSIYSIIFCIINIIVGLTWYKNHILIITSVILLIVYGFLLLFYKQIIKQNAEAYAKQLIAEFTGTQYNLSHASSP